MFWVCDICKGRVQPAEVIDGAGVHDGQKVHLVDAGPGHDQLEVHPVHQGFSWHRAVAPIRKIPPPTEYYSLRVPMAVAVAASVVWCDISEWQVPVNNNYPRPVLAYRLSLSTTKVDNNVSANHNWAEANSGPGRRLLGHIGYHVYYPGNGLGQVDFSLRTIASKWGARFDWMLDVESWGGQISGNRSPEITSMLTYAAQRLGGQARVCVYGNQGDLASIYPNRPSWLKVIVADYGGTPSIAHSGHQYTDGQYQYAGLPTATAPFGACDHNVSWVTNDQFVAAWFPTPAPPPTPTPPPTPVPALMKENLMLVQFPNDTANGKVSQGALYSWNGSDLTWLTGSELQAGVQSGWFPTGPTYGAKAALITDHKNSRIYLAPIAKRHDGTPGPDPRVPGTPDGAM